MYSRRMSCTRNTGTVDKPYVTIYVADNFRSRLCRGVLQPADFTILTPVLNAGSNLAASRY
jgi:hypothetical protein